MATWTDTATQTVNTGSGTGTGRLTHANPTVWPTISGYNDDSHADYVITPEHTSAVRSSFLADAVSDASTTGFGRRSWDNETVWPSMVNFSEGTSAEAIEQPTHFAQTRVGFDIPSDVVSGSSTGHGRLTWDNPTLWPSLTDYNVDGDAVQVYLGTYIPMGAFRSVYGTVVNEEGDPIKNAEWLLSVDGLPIAGPVDAEGNFSIFLLRTSYSNFRLLVRRADIAGLDYVWYEPVPQVLRTGDQNVELVFREADIPSENRGLMVGRGVSLGL